MKTNSREQSPEDVLEHSGTCSRTGSGQHQDRDIACDPLLEAVGHGGGRLRGS